VPEKTAKPARKRATPTKTSTARRPKTQHDEVVGREEIATREDIATRAYFIFLEEGPRDEVANWLRAERELTAA
jgi:Protein of unknown function (DUF2934)